MACQWSLVTHNFFHGFAKQAPSSRAFFDFCRKLFRFLNAKRFGTILAVQPLKDYVSCLVIIKRYKVLFRGTSTFALLDPLRVPIKTALVAVDEVARFLEAVELAGIDYEFGGNIEAAQGLIHLFAVEQWDVEIVPAAQK